MTYPTKQSAVDSLIADGFTPSVHTNGVYRKDSMTGGSLIDGPRPCVALCEVVHNKVDPKWNAPDYYTIKFI